MTFAKLASTIFSGQVQTYTNTSTGGGTGYYINLGGIKLCWGTTNSVSLGTSAGVSVSMPSSFFSTIRTANLYMTGSTTGDGMVRQTSQATTSSLSGWFTSGSSATGSLGWLVIGT